MIGQTLAYLQDPGEDRLGVMRDVYPVEGYEAWPQGRSQSPPARALRE